MRGMIGLCVIAPFVLLAPCLAQDHFSSGELEGFTRSRTEHIINQVDEPLRVRSVKGVIRLEIEDNPLKGALVEIRGPGESKAIMAAMTDKSGRFHFRPVPEGQYVFKITLDGYQSLTGRLVVDHHAKPTIPLELQLKAGV